MNLTDEQRAKLLSVYIASGMLKVVSDLAHNLCAPLWWHEPEEAGPGGRRSATVCLVDTGQTILGITADHVHTAVAERLDSGVVKWCQLGSHTFDPRQHVIDRDPTLDIATYGLSAIQIAATGRHLHHAPTWPPAPLSTNDICVVGGYPWEISHSSAAPLGQPSYNQSTEHHVAKFLHYFARLTDASPETSYVLISESTSIAWDGNTFPPDSNFGGMSGGPVFRFTERAGEISTLTLSAITSGHRFEVIEARPLSLVRADGTLIRE